jgi:hypothetical protein
VRLALALLAELPRRPVLPATAFDLAMPGKRRGNLFHDDGQDDGSEVEHRPREKPLLARINNLTGITPHRDAYNR